MTDLTCPTCGFECRTRASFTLHGRVHTNKPRFCSVNSCDSAHLARGLCRKHYERARKRGTTDLVRVTDLDRLSAVYEVSESGCWLFNGHIAPNGYGKFSLNGQQMLVHRAAYTLLVGRIPDGLDLDHVCHSDDKSCAGGPCLHRRCLNPAHLEPVTRRENLMRGRGGYRSAA